jgi:hypothetical protein
MANDAQPRVLAVAGFVDVRLIDGGDTIAVRFEGPDGREVAVLVPRAAATLLQTHLADALSQPVASGRFHR